MHPGRKNWPKKKNPKKKKKKRTKENQKTCAASPEESCRVCRQSKPMISSPEGS